MYMEKRRAQYPQFVLWMHGQNRRSDRCDQVELMPHPADPAFELRLLWGEK